MRRWTPNGKRVYKPFNYNIGQLTIGKIMTIHQLRLVFFLCVVCYVNAAKNAFYPSFGQLEVEVGKSVTITCQFDAEEGELQWMFNATRIDSN